MIKLIRIRERGEITLPAEVREFAKLQPGDYMKVEVSSPGKILLSKVEIVIEEEEKTKVS